MSYTIQGGDLAIEFPKTQGQAIRRREDERLITGRGRYAADIRLERLAHVAFVRSTLPHARIRSIDSEVALAMPGVLAVVTAADLAPPARQIANWVDPSHKHLARQVLAADEVTYAGEAIAAVVAETAYEAADAALAVYADLELLPAVTAVQAAAATGAPQVRLGEANLKGSTSVRFGDVEEAFASAPVVAEITLDLARVMATAMEPRSCTASWDPVEEVMTAWISTQGVFPHRDSLAQALALDEQKVVVLASDVGGGFGPKAAVYGEEIVVCVASRRLGRPLTWTAARTEDLATTVHSHGCHVRAEIAAEANGHIRGVRILMLHDLGAYPGTGSAVPNIASMHMMSAYSIPGLQIDYRMILTNAVPTGYVRGGGRQIGNFVIERLVDRLAAVTGFDPVELRRLNMIQPDQMPYDTSYPQGPRTVVYDSGDYPALLNAVVERVDYESLRGRRGAAPDGRLVGVGVASCVESSGFGNAEPARVRIDPDGLAHLFIGSTPHGQGHDTSAAQMLAERLGWRMDRVRVTSGDTRHTPPAFLTGGSRTGLHVGNAVAAVALTARRTLLERAADLLEADAADLTLDDGVISVVGVPAHRIEAAGVFPEGIDVQEVFDTSAPTNYPSGCHAAVVAVDPDTGLVEVLRYVAAHDSGRVINKILVEGQLQGGVAHGLGYALFEEALYKPDGTFQTATFLDYSIPTANEVGIQLELIEFCTPSPTNPEGVKGVGESGTIPVMAAVASAIEDALRRGGFTATVDHMPMTSEKVRALVAGA